MTQPLESFLRKRKLKLISKIAKGFAGDVFLVSNKNGKKFALKIERSKSRRRDMTTKEVLHLQKANSIGIGPKLIDFDLEQKIVLMEFINATPFGKWVFEKNVSKTKLKKTIENLLMQAKRLDTAGLDHGQLAGKGGNILVKKSGFPVIIDFEKASQSRRCHNVTQLESFLFYNPNSEIAKRIRSVLGEETVALKQKVK